MNSLIMIPVMLLSWAIGAAALYFIIKLAVKHAIQESGLMTHRKDQL